ncbi:hypothetical protein FB451DRAFT_1566507 [Mycena latifolia]|nr:hypothetical protein FB451DRAFT_1566507 [Mycena latifolia]
MPVSDCEPSPFHLAAARNGDALHLNILSRCDDGLHPILCLGDEPARRKVRPLPRLPALSPAPAAVPAGPRHAPRRRASGGNFTHLALPSSRKPQGFYVCNPSDSPISPGFPSPSTHSGPGQSSLPINIIPATPLPPPTPGIAPTHANLAPPHIRTTKMHRRLGGSVGAIPASALAELRTLGEERGRERAMTLPMEPEHSDSSSSDGDDDDDDYAEDDDEEYSWVVGKATRARVVRPSSLVSLRWVQDLGGDRWIADRYSSVLRAL